MIHGELFRGQRRPWRVRQEVTIINFSLNPFILYKTSNQWGWVGCDYFLSTLLSRDALNCKLSHKESNGELKFYESFEVALQMIQTNSISV